MNRISTLSVGAPLAKSCGKSSLSVQSPIKLALLAAVCLPICVHSSPAWADQSEDEESRQAVVVVTGEKRGEGRPLMEVGQSITALTGDRLEKIGAYSITDVIENSPGVNFAQTGLASAATIQIRGISTDYGDATVGYYLDDLPYTRTNQAIVPIVGSFDLDQIEILRGPQGTLYGAGSSSGVVLVRTKQAQTDTYEAKFDASVSTTEGGGTNYKTFGAVNVPLIKDVLGVRIVGGFESDSGYIDDVANGVTDFNDSETTNIRGKLTFTPTDNLTVRGTVWYKDYEGAAVFSNEDYENTSPNLFFPISPSGLEPFDRSDYIMYNGVVEYDFENLKLYSSTSFIDASESYLSSSVTPTFDTRYTSGVEALNQEIRVVSTHEGPLQWTAGAFYMDTEDFATFDLVPQLAPLPPLIIPFVNERYTDEQWATFGELHYRFWEDKIEATVGLRYTEDKRTADDLVNNSLAPLFGIATPRTASSNDVTPRFNLTAQWNDNFMTYVNVAKGFRPASNNALLSVISTGGTVPAATNADSLWTYEIGTKAQSTDGRISIEAALYLNDWSDLQAFEAVFSGSTPLLVGQNIGSAESYGIDLNLVLEPVDNLRLQLGGNLNSSEYGVDFGATGITIPAGSRIAQVPESSLNFAADYSFPIGGDNQWEGIFHFGLRQVAPKPSYFVGQKFESDRVTLSNARVGVTNDNWGLYLFADNLFDENGLVTAATATLDPGTLSPRPRPRTVGVNLKWNY